MQHPTPSFHLPATIPVTLAIPPAQSTPQRAHCASGSASVPTGKASVMRPVMWQPEMPFEKRCSSPKARTCMTSLIIGKGCQHSRSCDGGTKALWEKEFEYFFSWKACGLKKPFEVHGEINVQQDFAFGLFWHARCIEYCAKARTVKLCLGYKSNYGVLLHTSL